MNLTASMAIMVWVTRSYVKRRVRRAVGADLDFIGHIHARLTRANGESDGSFRYRICKKLGDKVRPSVPYPK